MCHIIGTIVIHLEIFINNHLSKMYQIFSRCTSWCFKLINYLKNNLKLSYLNYYLPLVKYTGIRVAFKFSLGPHKTKRIFSQKTLLIVILSQSCSAKILTKVFDGKKSFFPNNSYQICCFDSAPI